MKTWKQEHIDRIKTFYGKRIDAYIECHDDRRLYANIYNLIMEALSVLPEDPPAWLRCAVTSKLMEDMKTLDHIASHFDRRF